MANTNADANPGINEQKERRVFGADWYIEASQVSLVEGVPLPRRYTCAASSTSTLADLTLDAVAAP